MAITTAQRNAGYRQICLETAAAHPEALKKVLRVILAEVKGGTATQKEIAKACVREMYQAAFGVDPVGNHQFKHFLQALIQDGENTSDGLTVGDAIDAENVVVN